MRATLVLDDSRDVGRRRRRSVALVAGVTLAMLLGVTPTVTVPFGVFLVPVSEEFGWSRTATAGGLTALSLANAVAFPFAGWIADWFGARPVLLWGFLALGLAIITLSLLPQNLVAFYAMFAAIGAMGAFPSNMVLSKLLSQSFDRDRAFLIGLTTGVGNGLGAILMPVLALALLNGYGWRVAFVVIGVLMLAAALPVAWVTLRPLSRRASSSPLTEDLSGETLAEVIRRPLFWVICSTVAAGGGALTAVFVTTVPILTSGGVDTGHATMVLAVFALICTVWEPVLGLMLDRRNSPAIAAPFYLCAAAGVVLIGDGGSLPVLMAAGAMAGIGLGSEFSVLPYILSRYFGLRALGAIAGVAGAVVLVSGALVPLLLNAFYDLTGGYAGGLYAVAALLVYSAGVVVLLAPYPQRLAPGRHLEERQGSANRT